MFSSAPPVRHFDLWQEPDMGQQPQLLPQEFLPIRRSLRSCRMLPATRAASSSVTRIVPALPAIH